MPALVVRRCASTSSAARRALHRSITTVVPPTVSGRSRPSSEATCPAGKVASARVVVSAGTRSSPNSSVSWVCWTPFGAAVEPDVYSTHATDHGSGRGVSASVAAGRRSTAAAPSGADEPRTRTRSNPSGARRPATADATSAPRQRGVTTIVRAPVSATTWATSSGPAVTVRGTTTAPRVQRATSASVLAASAAACTTTAPPVSTPADCMPAAIRHGASVQCREGDGDRLAVARCEDECGVGVCGGSCGNGLADGHVRVPASGAPGGAQGVARQAGVVRSLHGPEPSD